MKLQFTPDIDKAFILARVSEEEIFEKYGVRVETGLFRSPLRRDRHPTCRFFRNRSGKLILKDFAGYFNGDCFDLVKHVTGLEFYDSLRDIAIKFKIIKGEARTPTVSGVIVGPKTLCDLRIKSAPWDNKHIEWWREYGIKLSTLHKFDVVPAERVWLNGSIYYIRTGREVVFAYKFGPLEYKVYFPEREKYRFLHNNPDLLQGYPQLPETGEMVIITKAMKDVMCLYEQGIPAIAPMAETSVVSDSVLEDLFGRFRYVGALYDRDRTGKCALINLRERGVDPYMMPIGTTKDFSDQCKLDISLAKAYAHGFKYDVKKKLETMYK